MKYSPAVTVKRFRSGGSALTMGLFFTLFNLVIFQFNAGWYFFFSFSSVYTFFYGFMTPVSVIAGTVIFLILFFCRLFYKKKPFLLTVAFALTVADTLYLLGIILLSGIWLYLVNFAFHLYMLWCMALALPCGKDYRAAIEEIKKEEAKASEEALRFLEEQEAQRAKEDSTAISSRDA